MEYREETFKKSANKKAMAVWMIIAIALSGAYAVEFMLGKRTLQYYLLFLFMCWAPFVTGLITLKVKGAATDLYKWMIAIGYGICLLYTSPSPRD